MYSIDELFKMGKIPSKFRGLINERCIDENCNHEIEADISLNFKRCSNPSCPMHMKFRAAKVLKYLGITGVAEQTCYNQIIRLGLKNHMDIIPLYFKDKPRLQLWEIAMLSETPGIDSQWQTFLRSKADLENLPLKFAQYKDLIKNNMKYFEVLEISDVALSVNICVHGRLGQYGTREYFTSFCNEIGGEHINTILKKNITNDTEYLVTYQPNDLACNKVSEANKRGIPIITPEMYVAGIIEVLKQYNPDILEVLK